MFTGLIEEVGTFKRLKQGTVCSLIVCSSKVIGDVELGDSVAVNGVCLTVTTKGTSELSFDAVPETISRSTLSSLRPGDKVNLEAALRAGKMMGGHIVQGHVDGVGTIASVSQLAESKVIKVCASAELLRYVVEKGSIAVDGISLTVALCDDKSFTVSVIPHTIGATTLELKMAGDKVNLETDIIGKYVEKFLNGRNESGVTVDLLRSSGFM